MPYKKINNHKIYYTEAGQGEPVLFIHGLGSSTKDWEYQTGYFSKSYKVISVDLRGHGKTGSIEGKYTIKGFAEDVSELLKEEKEPVNIVGISMGGMVAFQLVLDFPDLVKSLVIINSFVEFTTDNWKSKKELLLRKWIPRILGMKKMGEIIGKRVFPGEDQAELRITMAKRWAENSIKDYIKSVNAIAGWTVKDRLNEIQCPVLVVGSEYDYVSTEIKKEYTLMIPKGQFVLIPDARHAVSGEKPDELNDIISEFLQKI